MKEGSVRMPTRLGILVLVALVVAHAALFGFALSGHLSVAVVAGMLLLVFALKYAWLRRRREGRNPRV